MVRSTWISTISLLCVAAAALSLPSRGFAARSSGHADPPATVAVLFPDDSTALPPVNASFGLLIPHEADNWSWLCHEVTNESTLTALEILPDGTYLFGTAIGLWRSTDRCNWSTVADLDGLFITRLRRDALDPVRVWATSTSAFSPNYLWVSEDSGSSFAPGHDFGAGTSLRGFLQGSSGAPWYVFGYVDTTPMMWYSPDGIDWEGHALSGLEDASVYALDIDPNDPDVAYLDLRSSAGDQLVTIGPDGTMSEPLLELSGPLTAFAAGPTAGVLEAGGRATGLYRSTDGGKTWSGPDLSPEAGCLTTRGGKRYQCTHDINDGYAVMAAAVGSDSYEPVMRFGDVHQVEQCAAGTRTADICGPLWEAAKANAGMDQTPAPEDVTPTEAPEEGGGCGCSSAPRAGTSGGSMAWLMGIAFVVRSGRVRSRLRKTVPVALGALAVLAGGCAEEEEEGPPAVTFVSPLDGATLCGDPMHIELSVENFTLVPDEEEAAHPKQLAHEEGEGGHAHIYIDGAYVYQAETLSFELDTKVEDGERQLRVDLVNSDHTAVEPYTDDIVYVTVDNSLCGS